MTDQVVVVPGGDDVPRLDQERRITQLEEQLKAARDDLASAARADHTHAEYAAADHTHPEITAQAQAAAAQSQAAADAAEQAAADAEDTAEDAPADAVEDVDVSDEVAHESETPPDEEPKMRKVRRYGKWREVPA